jgi:hypothetical protein
MTKGWVSSYFRRYGLWLLLLVAAGAYYPRFGHAPLELYPKSGYCLRHGQVLQTCDPGFTYPPAFACVMILFDAMPAWLRNPAWYLVTIGATIGSFKLADVLARSAVAVPLSAAELTWMRVLGLLLSLKLVVAVFENQAYDAFVLVFLMAGLALLLAGREFWCGASLAFAAALKATPLIFLPYLLWKRHFVAAATFAVVFVAASYLPDLFFTPAGAAHGYFNTWLHEVVGASLDPGSAGPAFFTGANLLNHSLHGAVSLQIDETTQRALHHAVLYAVDAAFVAVVATLLVLSPRGRRSIAIDGSLLLISMLMLSPMTSRSHYVALLLPYMTLLTLNFHDQRTQTFGRCVLAASFVLVTLTSNDAVGETVTTWAYKHSFLVLGTLVLLIYFAALVIRRHRERVVLAASGSAVVPQTLSPSS